MSGIVGIVGDVDDIEYRLVAMLRSQRHRGDADRGFWVSSFVESRLGLAHCGKAVSEIEEDVRQPYVDEQTQLVVVMDGDIYNYRELRAQLQSHCTFVTDSSVEVVSKAYRQWGEECFGRMEGVFALAVYDRVSDMLLLVRDRFGVKPLYYTTRRGNIFFASEVRSLFAADVRRSVSTERWASYMLYGSYGPVYSTFWEDVYQLPAGCLMRYNGYSLSERCWYNLHDDIADLVSRYNTDELQTMLAEELQRSVGRCMLDVSSCGLRIAGRVESQLLHRIATGGQHRWKVRTFTGDIESIGRQPLASPIWVTASHALDELERMKYWVEEPFDGSETVVRTALFRYARRSGMCVVCSGVGLDALWQDVWDDCEYNHNYFAPHKLFSSLIVNRAERPHYEHLFVRESDNLRYLELGNERIPHILRVFDRSAAEAGVCVRMPFLNGRLVALSFALPMESNLCRKTLFENYLERYHHCRLERSVSQSLLPMWQSGGVREWVADMLDRLARSEVREWFDVKQLYQLREAFCCNMPCDVALLWKCISLQRQLGEM